MHRKRSPLMVSLSLCVALILTGCGDSLSGSATADSSSAAAQLDSVTVQSDGEYGYNNRNKAPIDPASYVLTGTVEAIPESVVRQTSPATASATGIDLGGLGFLSASFAGPEHSGKGLMRFHVESVAPATDLVAAGDLVTLKLIDLKAITLKPGEGVALRCRIDYEVMPALYEGETFNTQSVSPELDHCRLNSPVIRPAE